MHTTGQRAAQTVHETESRVLLANEPYWPECEIVLTSSFGVWYVDR